MTLGDKITQLRKQRGLSQDALAHELNISRQSISKWETGASVPELDKLVALSDLFQISLDELVRDTPPTQPPPIPEVAPPSTPSQQYILGCILLFLGAFCTVLALVSLRTLLLPGPILIVYGAICLLVKRHAGLVIGWITMAPVLLLHRSYTGIRLLSVFNPSYYQNVAAGNWILAWILWLLLALLAFATYRAIKRHAKED